MYGKFRGRIFSDIVLICSGLLVVFILPELTSESTGCLFNKFTGFYCAGCGISRGVHALLRYDITRAMHYNLLIVTAFPLAAIWLTFRYFKLKHSENAKKYDRAVIVIFIFTVLLFVILRNLPIQFFNFLRPD